MGVGYVEIKTVPAAPVTQAALYLGSTKLAPIRQGTALLRQHVGTLELQAEAFSGAKAPLCDIEVKKDRITSVTIRCWSGRRVVSAALPAAMAQQITPA
jgi:hypothetical protein